ncbi:MAG: flagellar hook-length control protein FliK [Sphingopyxis granuli]|uniref:flagellar hook-length control protein FliK n=1 Tax=Sphingopyxis granuli TaxID=267128 RepID=UPI003C74D4B4
MMSTALLQTPTQPGLAAILAAIGQAPAGDGESGFDELIAAMPGAAVVASPAAPSATPVADAAAAPIADAETALPVPTSVVPGEADAVPVEIGPAVPADDQPVSTEGPRPDLTGKPAPAPASQVAEGEAEAAPTRKTPPRARPVEAEDNPVAADRRAAEAAASLIAVFAGKDGRDAALIRTHAAAAEGETDGAVPTPPDGETPTTATTLPFTAVQADASAPAPATAAPAAPVPGAAAAAPTPDFAGPRDAAPTTPVTPAVVRPDATPTADPQAPKPAATDGGASMTVLFTQPAAPAATGVAPTAQPIPVAERTLDMGSDDRWIAQLAADIAATKSSDGDIAFRLMPRHLGRLDVAMHQGDEGVTLKLDTQHEATATIVHAAQSRLVEDLRQQGVRVAGAEVTCTPGETGRQSQQGQGRGDQPAGQTAHLIETATERAEPRDTDRAADRRGRFA